MNVKQERTQAWLGAILVIEFLLLFPAFILIGMSIFPGGEKPLLWLEPFLVGAGIISLFPATITASLFAKGKRATKLKAIVVFSLTMFIVYTIIFFAVGGYSRELKWL